MKSINEQLSQFLEFLNKVSTFFIIFYILNNRLMTAIMCQDPNQDTLVLGEIHSSISCGMKHTQTHIGIGCPPVV